MLQLGLEGNLKKRSPHTWSCNASRTHKKITLGGLNLVCIWASALKCSLNGNRGAESLSEHINDRNTDPLSQIPTWRGTFQVVVKVDPSCTCIQAVGQRRRCCWEHRYRYIGCTELIKGRGPLSKAMDTRTGIFNNAVLVSEAEYGWRLDFLHFYPTAKELLI